MSIAAESAIYLGIDLGTSGLKLTAVRPDGSIAGEAEAAYQVRAPRPGYAETDPAEWVDAFDRATRALAAALPRNAGSARVEPVAIGVTGQMHGLVLVDESSTPVRPAMLWPDQRATSELVSWNKLPAGVQARLANPLVAGMTGPMLSWLYSHEPAVLEAAFLVNAPKDWLRGRLTGDRSTERSDASATLLWDVVADGWSTEALTLAGISRDKLPTLVDSDTVVGTAPGLFGDHGGEAAIPVVAGAADTAAALTALKVALPADAWADSIVVNLGTGIQILRPGVTAAARHHPVTHLCADADGGWYEMLAIQNGGLAMSWVQQVLDVSWEELVDLASSSDVGSAGAVFTPFLTGERGGVASSSATGGWSGLTPTVGRCELARSAIEAFAFTIRRGIDLLDGDHPQVVMSGGGARDPWVRQLVADVLAQPVSYVQLRSASAVGAAVLAARGLGKHLPVPASIHHTVPSEQAGTRLEAAYTRWLNTIGTSSPLPSGRQGG